MKKAKKIVSFLLAVAMVAGLMSACNNEPAPASSDPASVGGESQDVSSEASEKDYSETLKFTMSTIDAENAGLNSDGSESAIWTWLREKYNVEFEYWPLTWGNYIDQTRMWLSTDDTPDLMMLDVHPTRYNEFMDWVNAGLFRAYDLTNAPNMTARLDSMTTGKKFVVDGELYAWPAYLDTVDYNFVQAPVFYYRTDWAKEVGCYNEDDVYTWDEWWDMLDKITEQKPGGPDTITMILDGVPFNYLTLHLNGGKDGFYKQDDGTWTWGGNKEGNIEALTFLKEKYDSGVLWRDQLILPENAANDNMNAGKLFCYQNYNTSTGSFMERKTPFEDANPGLVWEDCVSIAKIKSPDGKYWSLQGSDQWSQEAMSHKMTDEKAARWTDMLDYLVSDEGYYVRNMGIPEVDWKWEGDEVVCLWTTTDENGLLSNPYGGVWAWARAAGCNDNFSNFAPYYPKEVQDRVLSVYEAYSGPDSHIVPTNVEYAFFIDEEFQNITASTGENDKVVELLREPDFIEQYKAWADQKAIEMQPAIDILNNAGL